LTAVLTVATAAAGQAPRPATAPLTLEAAIAEALAANPALAAEGASARAAGETVRESRAARWPRLEVATDYSRTTHPVAVFGNLLSQERFTEANFDVGFLNEPDPLSNLRARVTVAQPLWAGGRISGAIEGAERQADAARAGFERARQELVFRVVDRYTGAVVAERAVAVRTATLDIAERNVTLTRDRFETGLAVESDTLQAQVRESEARAALASAERDAAVSRAALALEMGRERGMPLELPETLEVGPEEETPPIEALVERAVAVRPDLAAARAGVEAARAGLARARGGRLPELGWSGAYEADSEAAFDDPGTSWTLGVGLTWTGFDGGAGAARVARAQAGLDRAQNLLEQARRGVALEVEAAARGLDAARLRRAEAAQAVTLAKRSAEIVHDRYREGLTTVVELLEAETLLSGSRIRELQARRDLRVARAELALATGSL
jgi:outer membrane protein TolC